MMYLSHLSLSNFRNYAQLDLALGPGLFLFYGDNAQGKTNLLEAVSMLATASSFHAAGDREVVSWSAPEHIAHLHGIVASFNSAGEMGNMLRGRPADHLAIPGGMEGTGRSQHAHRFEQIRLTLGIVSIEEKESRSQSKVKLCIVAKIAQREVREIHHLSARAGMERPQKSVVAHLPGLRYRFVLIGMMTYV